MWIEFCKCGEVLKTREMELHPKICDKCLKKEEQKHLTEFKGIFNEIIIEGNKEVSGSVEKRSKVLA